MERLAKLIAFFCLLGMAKAQPSPSMQLQDASGKPMGESQAPVIVKVTGSVLDSDTRQPLPAFYVTAGVLDRDRVNFNWETNRLVFTQGAFKMELTKERLPPSVLIEAEGYLPQSSGAIREQETNLTFLLKKGTGPTGVVMTQDGHPAAGRTVYFSRLKDLVYLDGTNLAPRKVSSHVRSMLTDEAGRFSFKPDLEAFGVLVVDDAGFAEVRVEDLKSSPEVRLQPWGRVEGTLRIGTRLGSNETVRMTGAFAPYAYYPRPLPPFAISVETKTDATGHFVFPRVPPTDVKIFHSPQVGRVETGLTPISQITNITVKAGETRNVSIGGQGRTCVGRVVVKNYSKPINWQDEVFWIESVSPEPAECPNFDAISKEYRAAAAVARNRAELDAAQSRYLAEHDQIARQLCAYYSSPAGRKYWFSKGRYVLEFSQDGSFRIEDVPPGKYEMNIDLRELEKKMGQMKSPLIALGRKEIEMPDIPGGRCDTPLDLGVINMVARLNQGDVAPDFSVKTTDDKIVKLSDYRGKYVLLNFWAISNALSGAEIPDLRDTYHAYKNEPRLAMLGLSLDPDAAAARSFSLKNQFEWTQGFLGGRAENDLPDRFGVEKIPFVMLINPDGRVLVSSLPGGAIKSTVDSVLGGPPS